MNLVWLGGGELGTLGALSHREAREVLARAFQGIFSRAGEMAELQYAQAVSLGEGGTYGSGCYRDHVSGKSHCSTNNWGALQCLQLPPCPAGCVEATDSRDGTQATRYQACFRTFATPEAGAEAYLRRLYGGRSSGVLSLARQGRYEDAVHAQHRTRYFTLHPELYWSRVDKNVDRVAAALGEPRGDRASVRLVARGRQALPYVVAAGAAAAGAYYLFPGFRRVARRASAVVGFG